MKSASAVEAVSACGVQRLPKTEAQSMNAAKARELFDWIERARLKSHAK